MAISHKGRRVRPSVANEIGSERLPKLAAQLLESAMQQAAKRAVGQPQLLANGFVVGAADVPQCQRQPVFLGKGPQYGQHLVPQLFTLNFVFGLRRRTCQLIERLNRRTRGSGSLQA